MRNYRYHAKGFLYLVIGIILAFWLSRSVPFQHFLISLETFGYVAAFVAGLLFVSTLTVATGAFMLISLSHFLSPIWLSIFAGIGATCANYLIFLFIKKHISFPIKYIRKKGQHKKHHKELAKHGHWLLPFLGVLILASPLPDELGIILLSIYRMKSYQFVVLSFIFKVGGIFLLVSSIPRLLQ